MTEIDTHEHEPIDCPAIILCGGRSKRMGRDKAFLPLGTQTVLQRVEKTFAKLSTETILVIGQQADEPIQSGFQKIIRDQHLDYGPLEGIRVGLRNVAVDNEMTMLGTCDAPLVVPAVYRFLIEQMVDDPELDAALPLIDGRHYPLTAVYRTSVLSRVEEMVRGEQLRVRELLTGLNVRAVNESEMKRLDPRMDTIRNINTREEYEQILKEIPS